jgi:hypothetical protein
MWRMVSRGAIVGFVDYSFSTYKLDTANLPPLASGGLTRRIVSPAGPAQLALGTFNVRNLNPNDPSTS